MEAGVLAQREPRPDGASIPELEPALPSPVSELQRWLRAVWWTEAHRRLAAHPLFSACSHAEIRTMIRFGDVVQVKAGDRLLREDTIGSCFIAVLSGTLVLTRDHAEIGEIEAGGHVGDIAILGFGPQPATATAVSRSTLFVLTSRAFLSLAQDVPGLRRGLFPGLTRAEVLARVRALRRDGLPAWRTLRPTRRACSRSRPGTRPEPGSRASLDGATRELRFATEPFVGRAQAHVQPVAARARGERVRTMARCAGLIGLVAGLLATFVPVPYYSLHGEVRSATAIIRVNGVAVYEPREEVLFPIIVSHHDTMLDALRDWFNADADLRTANELFGDDTSSHVDHQNLDAMEAAKRSATAAVARATREDSPSITIDTGQIGGPSGGLAFALALYDLLTPGELTGGRRIAATGTITSEGVVGGVGGIRQKTLAARHSGVELLLVPRADYDDAVPLAGTMPVIAVDSFDDALNALRVG